MLYQDNVTDDSFSQHGKHSESGFQLKVQFSGCDSMVNYFIAEQEHGNVKSEVHVWKGQLYKMIVTSYLFKLDLMVIQLVYFQLGV